MERWAPFPTLEGVYEVSDLGNVRRAADAQATFAGRPLRPGKLKSGYLNVCTSSGGQVKNWRLHRVVYAAFHGPIPDGLEVNHLNGDKTDNRLVNLELTTRSGNMQHHYRVIGGRLPDTSTVPRDQDGKFSRH